MNDTDIEQELRDYYESITPADSTHATKLVISSLGARRAPQGPRREPRWQPRRGRAAARAGSRRLWTLACIAAGLTVAVVAGIGYATWRTTPNVALPGGAASPVATPTAVPSPTLRAATSSTPSHMFSPTGSMNARYTTATLLTDGRVLMTGDWTSTTVGTWTVAIATRSAELYDPATDTFSPTGSMVEARGSDSVTRLQDGRVLFAGGITFSDNGGQLASTQFATAELYDPKTGLFSATGSMTHAREGQTAALLADGEVLIIGGGGDAASGFDGTAELYDPKTGTFRSTGSLVRVRYQPTATTLMDGRVLIVGGFQIGSQEFAAQAELYDPATGKFSLTSSMTTDRSGFTATLLQNGKVLIAGGGSGTTSLATAELFDPATGKFNLTGSMATGREAHNATLLYDGRVLVAGGSLSSGGGFGDPNTSMTQQSGARSTFTTLAGCQRVAISGRPSMAARYDIGPSVASVGSGIMGATVPSTQLTSAELYDPETGKFTPTGSMGTVRSLPTATALPDGRALFSGGDSPNGTSAELYQP